jgi:hypothetical protein
MTSLCGRDRKLGVGLALFAVLFQAILFGWHHQDLIIASHLPTPVIEKPAAAPQVVDDEDGCEICQVLHHLTAAPVNIDGALPPPAVGPVSIAGEAILLALTLALAFRARAPPTSDAAIG